MPILSATDVAAEELRNYVIGAWFADFARRNLKPELPFVGSYGIPMRDELDLTRISVSEAWLRP